MSQFADLGAVKPFEPTAGVLMHALFGEKVMLNLLDMEPGSLVPLHSHPHEQLGYVLEGELILTVEGREHRLQAGHAYQLAGGVEHGGRAGSEGCRILDVFHPVREDYRELAGA